MSTIVFLGDEAYASAFRLIGIDARAVRRGEEARDFAAARATAQLLLIDARTAERIPPAVLDAALVAADPLLLVLPTGVRVPDDPAGDARRLLGMSSEVPNRLPGRWS